ncbi:MAG: hypothetical protein AAF664_19250 [Planctomycetota bacterium]
MQSVGFHRKAAESRPQRSTDVRAGRFSSNQLSHLETKLIGRNHKKINNAHASATKADYRQLFLGETLEFLRFSKVAVRIYVAKDIYGTEVVLLPTKIQFTPQG